MDTSEIIEPTSSENVSDPVTEILSDKLMNLTVNEIGTPENSSVINDTLVSNTTLVKKFTCLLEDMSGENSTFQVQPIVNPSP